MLKLKLKCGPYCVGFSQNHMWARTVMKAYLSDTWCFGFDAFV